MADPRFFSKQKAMSAQDIANLTGSVLADDSHAGRMAEDVAALDKAEPAHLSFFDNIRYKDSFTASKAGICIVPAHAVAYAPAGMALIVAKNPYKAYAIVAQHFYPDIFPASDISGAAHIDASAVIGKGCVIEPGAVIKSGAVIGDGCWIESNAVVGTNVIIGAKCRVGAGASISHAVIGDAVRLYPGVRIGQDGFGFAIDPAGHVKVPQLGRVVIEDNVEIGANSCVDRGAGPDTVISAGAWIDNLVQIAHNVKIGKGCVLVSQSGIAGSSVMEDYSILAAQAGVAGHLRIGKAARVGAKAGVMKDIPAGEEQLGAPAMPIRDFMRQVIALKRLTAGRKTE